MAYNSKTLPRLGRPWNDSGSDSSRYVRHIDTTCASLTLPQSTHGGNRLCSTWICPPPPCRLPHCPHTSTGAFTRPLAYPEVSSISSFGIQRLTTQRSSPGSPRPCNDFGSVSLKYVRYIDTACASLMLVMPSTVHARRQPACSTLDVPLAAFLAAPRLHGGILKVFSIPRSEFNIFQGIVRCPMVYKLKTLPGLAQTV